MPWIDPTPTERKAGWIEPTAKPPSPQTLPDWATPITTPHTPEGQGLTMPDWAKPIGAAPQQGLIPRALGAAAKVQDAVANWGPAAAIGQAGRAVGKFQPFGPTMPAGSPMGSPEDTARFLSGATQPAYNLGDLTDFALNNPAALVLGGVEGLRSLPALGKIAPEGS